MAELRHRQFWAEALLLVGSIAGTESAVLFMGITNKFVFSTVNVSVAYLAIGAYRLALWRRARKAP